MCSLWTAAAAAVAGGGGGGGKTQHMRFSLEVLMNSQKLQLTSASVSKALANMSSTMLHVFLATEVSEHFSAPICFC